MKRTGVGALVLVLGILSLVGFGCLTGIPAWVVGNNALRDIDRGYVDESDRSLVVAGRVMGMITTILTFCAVGFWVLMLLGFLGVAATSHSSSGMSPNFR